MSALLKSFFAVENVDEDVSSDDNIFKIQKFQKYSKYSTFFISRGVKNDSFGDDIQSARSNSIGKMVHGDKSETKVKSCSKFDWNDTKTTF